MMCCANRKDMTFQNGVNKALGKHTRSTKAEICSIYCTIYAEKLLLGMLSLFMINNNKMAPYISI